MGAAIRDSGMMREASRLVEAHGEIGNSDAIRLLQLPHTPGDSASVIRTFEQNLTPQARSQLTLDALVPPQPGVVDQRHEPIFDKYRFTGKTYTTASGAVIPDDLQYYNGEMALFYGECANVAGVSSALTGSGYRAITLEHEGGRRTVAAQLWCNRFTDTSIGPYSAMFIVVAAVPDVPSSQSSIRADASGASSALVMLDGSFDAAAAVYENRARLFLVRLIDSTQVAIDVGRERMGTDKRLGTVDVNRSGRRLRVSIRDRVGRGVASADVELSDDPASCMAEVARAAAAAGVPLRPLPRGTEYVYPVVARIGQGPVVSSQWRTDSGARLQRVVPGTVVFDPTSDEGRMLLAWGFTPQVLAYIANVRGVVTGLADQPTRQVASVPAPGASQMVSAPLLRAAGPGVGSVAPRQMPILRFARHDVSPGLEPHGRPPAATDQLGDDETGTPEPRWTWDTRFLGSLTAMLRKEVVGITPDGLRIDWHVTQGTFVGPGFDAIVLPGAADWMRIRRDGVAVVSVQACFETRDGARVFGSYGGIFDLGPDGYARALRDEFDRLPPVVVTPTYATADARLAWLNRAQCLGVGRVDMAALRVEFDVYAVRVGGPVHRPSSEASGRAPQPGPETGSLYQRLGGQHAIVAITDDFLAALLADRRLARFFASAHTQAGLRERVVEFLCEITGGPCVYRGRDMKTAHEGLGITVTDWQAAIDLFARALRNFNVAPREHAEFVQLIQNLKPLVIEA